MRSMVFLAIREIWMQKYEKVVAWLIYDMESEGCARGTKVCRRERRARAKVYLCFLAISV
jgi:hypothetical protein